MLSLCVCLSVYVHVCMCACVCVCYLCAAQMYEIYVWCNKVKPESRLLFEATKDPVSTSLILIKYYYNEDLNSLRIHLEL